MKRIGVFGPSDEPMLASPCHVDLSSCQFWRGDEIFGEELFLMRGVLQRLREEPGVEIVPIMGVRCRATPVFSRAQFNAVKAEMLERIAAALPLDGIAAANHGAMEVEGGSTTADMELVRDVRALVGPHMPVTMGLDMHGHLTPGLLFTVQVFSVYRTAPCRDEDRIGCQVADQLLRVMGSATPSHGAVHMPMFLPGDTAMTTWPPADWLYVRLDEYDAQPGVIEANLMVGFAWNDLPWAGMHATVTTDGGIPQARSLAQEIAGKVWARRKEFGRKMPSFDMEEGLHHAMSLRPPMILSDSGDNVTAAACGGLTLVLQQVLDMTEIEDVVVVNIVAPGTVDAARVAGAGAVIEVKLGAEHLPRPTARRKVLAEVLRTGQESRVEAVFCGPSSPWAVLRIGKAIASFHLARVPLTSPGLVQAMGIDSLAHRMYVYKVGYRQPDLEDLRRPHVLLLSDGTSNLDLTQLSYTRIRRPAHPFEPDMTSTPSEGLHEGGRE